MITIDTFRICAKEQLEQIGDIMRIPVSCALNKQDIRKEIALCGDDIDLVLIDTIGNSPRDSSKLGEMKEILDGCPKNAEYHLVISAATKSSDIEVIMRQFEPFNYKSIILTKMDETDSYGNIISALAEKRKCLSFITNGQGVPEDIGRASVVQFLINLDGFKVDRDKIEKRFPSGEADQFKWR
jgi:flagellar biosynthesis protein FlhF